MTVTIQGKEYTLIPRPRSSWDVWRERIAYEIVGVGILYKYIDHYEVALKPAYPIDPQEFTFDEITINE